MAEIVVLVEHATTTKAFQETRGFLDPGLRLERALTLRIQVVSWNLMLLHDILKRPFRLGT